MSFVRTIGTILIAAVVGTFAFVFTSPKKVSKNKVKTINSRADLGVQEKEDLFI